MNRNLVSGEWSQTAGGKVYQTTRFTARLPTYAANGVFARN
ncbi:hypothetical protein QWI17_21475 [Gilvimarinus sp. SDUM040013]|uniref:Uncharacterized protein n=1 Tax=Gilvimarinus gilvus TaxID=3058038 RepID=A0ABU4RV06_9GAMM|nr:hypothetical protein [Gilvimarinus sp. SDUM040013]MDO3388432.1 hypothetical protein [Gilvimarinus sp. SDUM040013]MDX6847982.1 hypothetical protein [Gilvimarinus sp. SDUM040013]